LIGKKSCIKKLLHQRNEVGKKISTSNRGKKKKKKNYVQEERESKNSGMDFLKVNPHARDQSNKVTTKKAMESTKSSNMRLFLSLQLIHLDRNICIMFFKYTHTWYWAGFWRKSF